MANIIARIGVYGDIHLNSKNYGAHRDYPAESLEYFTEITRVTREKQLTHLIGLGDFSFGRFHTLEYRLAVERNLEEQFKLTQGNRFEIKGNHDAAGYGFTERDYYVEKGLLRPSTNLQIGNLNLNMVDYGKTDTCTPIIIDDDAHVNMILAHDFFKFRDTPMANFGQAIELDNYTNWFGVDYIVLGHVHKIMKFKGYIVKDSTVHETVVDYLGCMTRPSYRDGYMDEEGHMLIITVFDDGNIDIDTEIIKLWSLEDSFNLEVKQKQAEKKEEKEARVDISDIVKQLDAHDRNVGNPEDIIAGMEGIDEKYKNKAIDLLKSALA